MDKIKERELQHELATAVTREVEYRRIDDMKKRAIHSAASYDEFKNLVACANLQPVSRSDLESLGKTARGVRNSTASTRTSRRGRSRVTAALSTEPRAATSTQDLATVWRRCGLDFSSKMRILELTTAPQLASLAQRGLEAGLIVDIVQTLEHEAFDGAADASSAEYPGLKQCAALLLAVLQGGGTKTTLQLLSARETSEIKSAIIRIAEALVAHTDESLMAAQLQDMERRLFEE